MLRREAGLNRNEAAKVFEVSTRTIRNWDARKNRPPRAVFLYLWALCGRLDHMSSDWKGFKFHQDCILSPEGDHLYSWEVRAIRYLFQAGGINRTRLSRPLQMGDIAKNKIPVEDGIIKIFKAKK